MDGATGRPGSPAGSPRRSLRRRRDARGAARPSRPTRPGRPDLLLLRLGPRLRSDVDDPGLAAVGRAPRVVVEKPPGGGVYAAADARRTGRLAALRDDGDALVEVRV